MLPAGCQISGPPAVTATPSPVVSSAGPSIKIMSGGSLPDNRFVVRVEIKNFKLDGTKIGKSPEPGVGQWHLLVDGQYAGLSVSDSIALPNDALPKLEAGQHQLTAQLHDNMQKPLSPPVEHSLSVEIPLVLSQPPRGATPNVSIQRPTAGSHWKKPMIVVIKSDGLKLDGTKIGQPVAPGVGHWELSVDGQYAGLSVSDVITLPNDAFPSVAAGPRTLKVDLRDDLRRPLSPSVTATVQVVFDETVAAHRSP